MKIQATRGVCIGAEKNLTAGEIADVDAALGLYLISIKAAEHIVEPPAVVDLQEKAKEEPKDSDHKSKKK